MINDVKPRDGKAEQGLPSEWYRKAKDTVVYRLSELIFGSLLAAFVLGFVGFSGFEYNESQNLLSLLIKTCTYLCISAIYTYYTAGLYLYYHTGILTMPTFAFQKNAPRDFRLALYPAVAFGFSMLDPTFLMISLGIVILASLIVHRKEQSKVVKYFDLIYFSDRRKIQNRQYFDSQEKADKVRINNALLKHQLIGWLPTSKITYLLTILLIILGLFYIWFVYNSTDYETISVSDFFERNEPTLNPRYCYLTISIKAITSLLISLLLLILVYWRVKKVFNLAVRFLTDPEGVLDYDSSYSAIMKEFNETNSK